MERANNKRRSNADFYSKIKDVLIELHHYSFFHSHSGNTYTDRRFIGRKAVKDKLTNIITKSETKSGAYLITGFRGTGKTSTVNTVIDEVSDNFFHFAPLSRLFRVLILLFLIALIRPTYQAPFLQFLNIDVAFGLCTLLSIVTIACFIFFVHYSQERNQLGFRNPQRGGIIAKWVREIVIIFPKIFEMRGSSLNRQTTSNAIAQDTIVLGIVYFTSIFHFLHIGKLASTSVWDRIFLFFAIFIGYMIVEVFVKKITEKYIAYLEARKKRFTENIVKDTVFGRVEKHILFSLPCALYVTYALNSIFLSFFKGYIITFILCGVIIYRIGKCVNKMRIDEGVAEVGMLNALLSHIDFSHILTIKINLGKEDLRDIDVLRLVAKNTYQNYKNWYYSRGPFKKLMWKILFLGIVLSIISSFYYFSPIYRSFKVICYESGYMDYAPSQALMLIENDSYLTNSTNILYKNLKANAFDTRGYIHSVNNILHWGQLSDSLIRKNGLNWQTHEPWLDESIDRSSWRGNLKELSVSIDYFVFITYKRFVHTSEYFFVSPLDESVGMTRRFPHFPPCIPDYWFLLWFLFTLLLLRFLLRRSIFLGFRTHRYVLGLLEELVENLDANIVSENGNNIPSPFQGRIAILFNRKIKTTPIMEAKAIENKMIFILNEIDKIPSITIRPRLIYVFDELDKIEPNYQGTPSDKEAENVRLEGTRKRQEIIAKLLTNLKHFFNEAKAKFIFIAGREMYDAALADISDRDAPLGSVFHDVLYINSFLTDDSEHDSTDILRMTEWYVCQFLFPLEDAHLYPFTLKGYNQFLKRHYFSDTISDSDSEKPMSMDDLGRQKIVLSLHYFITFLAHKSNGSPKKITNLFEDYVIRPKPHQLNDEHTIVIGQTRWNFYLYFDYPSQYRMGFATYLYTPFLMRVSPFIHEMGDNLLVSTTFLIDHLYKFHAHGFSWRNIEMAPELVASNKDPYLRNFVSDLVDFISRIHMRKIPSGLHEYRFNKKISSEIGYISQISEQESAAYNFTYDDSLQLKRFFKSRLIEIRKSYAGREQQLISSTSYVHMILGDLSFYAQDFDEAIIHYSEAVQPLRAMKASDMLTYQFTMFIRNMLKLGLVNEYKKQFEAAYITYSQLSSHVVGYRNVEMEKLGLKEFVLPIEDLPAFVEKFIHHFEFKGAYKPVPPVIRNLVILPLRTKPELKNAASYIVSNYFLKANNELKKIIRVVGRKNTPKDIKVRYETNSGKGANRSEKVYREDDRAINMEYFLGFSEDFFDSVYPGLRFGPAKEESALKISLQENFRLLYQPIIAKLHISEKISLSGITLTDLQKAEEEFNYLKLPISSSQKYLIETKFYSKIGNLLFYKNGLLFGSKIKAAEGNDSNNILRDSLTNIIGLNDSPSTSEEAHKEYRAPITAYEYYLKSFALLVKRTIQYNFEKIDLNTQGQKIESECFLCVFKFLEQPSTLSEKFPIKSNAFLDTLGGCIVDLADCLLSIVSKDTGTKFRKEFLYGKLSTYPKGEPLSKIFFSNGEFKFENLHILEQTFLYYYTAALVFRKDMNYSKSNSQLLKLLHLLNEIAAGEGKEAFWTKEVVKFIEDNIVNVYLRDAFRSYEHSNRPELLKLREIFDKPLRFSDDKSRSAYINNAASVSTDAREVILIYASLLLRVGKELVEKEFWHINQLLVTPFSVINKRYIRIWELNYKSRLNFNIFQSLIPDSDKKDSGFMKDLINCKENKKQELFNSFYQHILNAESNAGAIWNQNLKIMQAHNNEMGEDANYDLLEFLIADSIFCLTEMIKSHKIFGANYVATSFSILANTHEKMSFWCNFNLFYSEYQSFRQSDRKDNVLKKVRTLTNSFNQYLLSPWYHYEMAISNYKIAIELHSEGNAYKEMIKKQYYLDDDYNDDILHFSLALERFKINTGRINKAIINLEERINDHHIYTSKGYFDYNFLEKKEENVDKANT